MSNFYIVEGKIRNNIGDILQGMAAAEFLDEDAQPVDRETLAMMDEGLPGLLLANGWFMHDFSLFPPPPNIKPVYLSVHIANSAMLRDDKIRTHFKANSPIGCRDHKTLKLFLGWGIPAYYSGCLTITTKKRRPVRTDNEGDYLLVDNIDHPVPDVILNKIEGLTQKKLTRISHDPMSIEKSFDEYVRMGKEHMDALLHRYCDASLIITTKIHCALPCLGMGANVMLIHPNPNDPRLDTVKQFMDILSYEQILKTDAIIKSSVNINVLNAQKKYLTQIALESVKNKTNIIRNPKTIGHIFIKYKAVIAAFFYRMAIVTLLKTGFATPSIKRVFCKKSDLV
jgi:hypothetical protein